MSQMETMNTFAKYLMVIYTSINEWEGTYRCGKHVKQYIRFCTTRTSNVQVIWFQLHLSATITHKIPAFSGVGTLYLFLLTPKFSLDWPYLYRVCCTLYGAKESLILKSGP